MAVTVTIAGVSSPVIPFESLEVTEALAMPAPAPSTASFEIVDKANTITVADLADVTIADGAETLFRGQVVDTDEIPVANYKRIAVTCQDYNRITPGCPVGQPVGGGGDLTPADGSGASIPWDTQASTGWLGPGTVPDSLAFQHFIGHYWRGPTTDTTTYVDSYWSLKADVHWSDTTLDVVLADICGMSGPGQLYWLDADLKWHFTHYPSGPSASWTITGSDQRLARGLPVSTLSATYSAPLAFSDTPNFTSTFPTHEIHRARDMKQIAGSAYVRGATVGGSGWETNPFGAPTNAPAIIVSAPSRTIAERAMYAWAELARRAASAPTYSFYTLGGTGWHRGQHVSITNSVLGLSAAPLVIRSLKLTMLNASAQRRYDIEVGDQRSLSLAWTLAGTRGGEFVPPTPTNVKDPAVRFVFEPLWNPIMNPGDQQTISAQLTSPSGDPMRVPGVKGRWQLWKNSVPLGNIGSAAVGSYLALEDVTTDFTGRVYNNWYVDASASPGDWFDVTIVDVP